MDEENTEDLKEKITSVKQFDMTENGLNSETKKKKTGQHQEWMEFKTFSGKSLDQPKMY